jgi:hypothetical protein
LARCRTGWSRNCVWSGGHFHGRGGQCLAAQVCRRLQCAFRPGAGERERSAPPLTEADDLDEIRAWREERTVTRNLTLRYDRMMLLLDPTPFARGLAGKKVEVVNYLDGRFAVRHEGVVLPFRVFDKIQTVAPGAIVEHTRLGAALAFARELQASYLPNRRRGDPRRQRPPNNLEAPGVPTKGRPSRKVLAGAGAE